MWNATAAVHARAYVADLLERIRDPDFSTFDAVERRIFSQLDLRDKDVIQLSCNNGRELISVKRAGAGRCVGVDISDPFILQARELATAAGVDVGFVCSDLYALESSLDEQFDLVYITVGALGWLPDLAAVLALIDRLLRPGGSVFIYEMHPILDMFDPDTGLEVRSTYFRTEPYTVTAEADYMDPTMVVEATSHWFTHTLSDVIGGLLRHGFRLEHFEEHRHDISMVFASFQDLERKPPLCYSLLARKPR